MQVRCIHPAIADGAGGKLIVGQTGEPSRFGQSPTFLKGFDQTALTRHTWIKPYVERSLQKSGRFFVFCGGTRGR
jgi:hypothetical protein